jgi:hypothetical protein
MPNFRKISKRAKWILYPTSILAWLNFVVFWVVTVCLGGDAGNGYSKNGHFFVCAHGACHEVSKAIWNYSYWHSISAFWGIFLVFIELAVFVTTKDIELDYDQRL